MTNQNMQMEIYEKRIGDLQWNFDELNKALDQRLEIYKSLVYSADQITEAKKDRAALNSLNKQINDRRIELKKEFCEPYDIFAAQVKQLTIFDQDDQRRDQLYKTIFQAVYDGVKYAILDIKKEEIWLQ